ncbi:hypothetical protein GWI33_006658 [Rhynchophorus ferrugineus]|uniref:CHK kinase-like domain-containing protein n=1 Tax=Rhynchophorus ferrugineus TaxID=354439 RepID=A0A834ILE6_RHYFE|nr:hypothetical protein GWI33_006658 [Rhynchophorus ferrugineus]
MSNEVPEIIDLDFILSRYENTDIVVLSQEFVPCSNIFALKLSVTIDAYPFDGTKVVNYFVKLCKQDTNIDIRTDYIARFQKEIYFYQLAIPAITNFQRDRCIRAMPYYNLFPKCIGARLNIDREKTVPDETAVLILEELKEQGYQCENTNRDCSLQDYTVILTTLAYMHAVPLAMRTHQLDSFKSNVLPSLLDIKQHNKIPHWFDNIYDMVYQVFKFNDAISPYFQSIKTAIEKSKKYTLFGKPFTCDCWITLCHSNFSKLNLMMKCECIYRGKSIKILDNQTLEYSHCCNDLIFFLFTSVNSNLLNSHYDFLVCWYYDFFVYTLTKYEIDVRPYTVNNFYKELKIQGPRMILQILRALPYITNDMYDEDKEPVLGMEYIQKLGMNL